MKFSIIGDLHLTHRSLETTRELFDLVEQIGLPAIWLGDLFDTKEVIRGKCQNIALDYFKTSKVSHYILVGNHDWFNLNCDAHALETLKLLPNVKIVDEPFAMTTLDVVMIPYIHDKVKLLELLGVYSNKNKVLIGHLEVTDFDFGNGHICTTGVKLSDLGGFSRVISGHFHKYQTQSNLTYVGTPFSHSFGEANQVKYIAMFDAVSNELKLAETPFPQHLSYEIDCDREDVRSQVPKLSKRNHYRIILNGSQENIAKFPTEIYSEFSIKWIARPSDYSENTLLIDETASNEAQFTKWARDVKKLDNETVQLGLQILEACR